MYSEKYVNLLSLRWVIAIAKWWEVSKNIKRLHISIPIYYILRIVLMNIIYCKEYLL